MIHDRVEALEMADSVKMGSLLSASAVSAPRIADVRGHRFFEQHVASGAKQDAMRFQNA